MPSTATVTAKVGPGNTVTAQVLTYVTFFSIDVNAKILRVTSNGIQLEFDINAATTYTLTVSSGNYTLTIS